jgi:hypothetical protein
LDDQHRVAVLLRARSDLDHAKVRLHPSGMESPGLQFGTALDNDDGSGGAPLP